MKVPCLLKCGISDDGEKGWYLLDNRSPIEEGKALDEYDNSYWNVIRHNECNPDYFFSGRILADIDIILDANILCSECEGGEDHDRYRTITTDDIETIKDNDGRCYVEMYELPSENNSEESKLAPLFYCGHIVIHLTK